MGLDIYSGKLIRYYSRNWKTIVQQWSEENGHKCVMTDGNGNEMKAVDDEAELEQIRESVCGWIDAFARGIGQPAEPALWDETVECGYYTDKPDWEAFGALVMAQACLAMDRPLPEYVEKGWDVFEEPVVKEAVSRRIANSLLSEVEIWLPVQDNAIYFTEYPTGKQGAISTVSLLKRELEDLNRQLWKADEAAILSWSNDKYYVAVKSKLPKSLFRFSGRTNKAPKEKYRTEDLAQCAYSMLYRAVRFAEEHRVPILLDF